MLIDGRDGNESLAIAVAVDHKNPMCTWSLPCATCCALSTPRCVSLITCLSPGPDPGRAAVPAGARGTGPGDADDLRVAGLAVQLSIEDVVVLGYARRPVWRSGTISGVR